MTQSTNNAIVVAIAQDDIERIRNGETVRDDERNISICKRDVSGTQPPRKHFFRIHMSDKALERVENNEIVNYGINLINKVNQELFVRKGKISESIGANKTVKERLVERGMNEEEVERYTLF